MDGNMRPHCSPACCWEIWPLSSILLLRKPAGAKHWHRQAPGSFSARNQKHETSQDAPLTNHQSFISKVHFVNKYILCTYLQSKRVYFTTVIPGYSNSESDVYLHPLMNCTSPQVHLTHTYSITQHVNINIHNNMGDLVWPGYDKSFVATFLFSY